MATLIAATEQLTGRSIERAYVDKGYRGHNTEHPRRVFISGQKRGVFGSIKRELRRRSAIEAAIGHMKTDGHLSRCYLKGAAGDAANVILSGVGHNLPPRPRLAGDSFAPDTDRARPPLHHPDGAKPRFLTADYLAS